MNDTSTPTSVYLDTDEFTRFTELHHEFGVPMSDRAQREVQRLEYDEKGERLPNTKIQRNIAMFSTRIRALIPQLEGNPKWNGRAATENEFRKSPRTLQKSMQGLLGTPLTRMAYSRDESVVRDGDLSTILIDAQTITPTLLRNLGLHRYLPPKHTRKAAAAEHMARAVPEIRSIISQLKPFRLTHEDLGSQKKGYRLYVTPDGYVIGIQSNNGHKVMYSTDIHGAYRRIDHIRANYNLEIRKLKHIQREIANVAQRVRSNWPQAKEELPEIQQQMLKCVKDLTFVEDRHKKKMRELIRDCVSFRTIHEFRGHRQERFNPGSRLARLVTIPGYVGKRIRDIESIRGYLEQDQVRIKDHIDAHQAPVESFYRTVEDLHDQFDILDPQKSIRPEKGDRIHRNLDRLRQQCEPDNPERENYPLLQPYCTYARAIAEHVDVTKTWLSLDNRDKAKEEFMKMYVVAKIQHSFMKMQDFYDIFLSPPALPDFERMIHMLANLRRGFWRKKVSPETTTPEYSEFWSKRFGHLLHELQKGARAGKNADSQAEQKKIKERMRECFRSFRFEDIT